MSQDTEKRFQQFIRSTAGYMTIKEAHDLHGSRYRGSLETLYRERAELFDAVIRRAREILGQSGEEG